MRFTEDYELLSGTEAAGNLNTTEAATDNGTSNNKENKTATASTHSLGSTESHDTTNQRHGALSFARPWQFEILSMICSVSALLAIVAVLFAFDGESMTLWKAALRPNTVVSALSTLAKSSMLMVVGQGLGQLKWQHFEQRPRRLLDFDVFGNASRGPWGSVQLLYHIHWKALAGSMGAVITILALAMDPFAQQVISFGSRQVVDLSTTSVIRAARVYDTNSQWESSTDAASHERYNKVKDTKFIGAVYQGVFGSNSLMPYRCPSGDCAWASYMSLGICNSCVDVTAATNFTRVCKDGERAQWNESLVLNRTCAYETPSGYRVSGSAVNWKFMCSAEQYHTLWNSTMFWEPFPRGRDENAPVEGIVTIAALNFDEYDDTVVASPEVWLESAQKCTLSWCAMEFGETSVKNGQLDDVPTRSEPLVFMNEAPCYDNHTGNTSTMGTYAFSISGINTTSFIVPGFEPDYVPKDLECLYGNGEAFEYFRNNPRAFWVNTQDNKNLQSALGSIFTTTFESISRPGDDPASALFRAESFPNTMDKVADGMTDRVRIGPNVTEIHGNVQIGDQHIYVQWPWMILPASLVLLSVVFLITSMVTATRQCRGWKSSVLPGFYHGLSGWDGKELRIRDIEDMQRSAKGMWVKLGADDEGGAKLVRAKKLSDG